MNLVKKTEYGTDKHILIANDSFLVSLPIKVSNASISAVNGKKIVKAGTPLAGDITDRATAFTKGTASNAVGVLLHDVDVTEGTNNGTIVLAGCVDLLKMDSDVSNLYTTEMKTKLSNIIAVKGSAI